MIKVSIIVTTYNRPKLLKETIDSILNQTYADFELIVVDNNSSYDFFELIKSFNDSRIMAYQNNNKGIIAVNRNFGINKSNGAYIAFCDDDDIWLSEKLETQIKFLLNDEFDLIYSNTILLYNNGGKKESKYSNVNNLRRLLYNNQITLSSVLLRKNTVVSFNESYHFVAIEDYELWIRLMIEGYRFKFIEKPLIQYRILSTSVSRQSKGKNEKVSLNFRLKLLKEYELSLFLKMIVFYKVFHGAMRNMLFLFVKL